MRALRYFLQRHPQVKAKAEALQAVALKIGQEIYGGGKGGDAESKDEKKDEAEEADFKAKDEKK